jgi:hypothetical protein
MREIVNVTSTYRANTRTTTVQITVGKKTLIGTYAPCITYTGKAKWNKKCDDFNPAEGFRVAYERALAQIPKENIIEKCGGLRDGDWVRVQSKDSDYETWGIVFHGNILYMMGNGNYDKVSVYSDGKGETEWDRITTVVRPISSCPITYDYIYNDLYELSAYKDRCKVYTAD